MNIFFIESESPLIIKRRLRKVCPITGKIHDRTDSLSDKYSSKIPYKVSCSFQTNYHTDLTTFGVDQADVVSDSVEGASAPTTSFTFDLVMTTDHQLDEEVPEGFSRVIGDMNYFKVKHYVLFEHSNHTFSRLLRDISPLVSSTRSPNAQFMTMATIHLILFPIAVQVKLSKVS